MIKGAHFEEWGNEFIDLAWHFRVNPESCGNACHFENYIRFIAITDNLNGMAKTHVLLSENNKDLMVFVSLRATALIMKEDGKLLGEPAIEISNLAVSQDFERMGVGTALIDFVLATTVKLNSTSLGVKYIALSADAKAVEFYKKKEFELMEDYWELPRENWNTNCTPMVMQLYNAGDASK